MPEPRDPAPCPRCGTAGVPIMFGYPGAEWVEQEARGEIVLGGCVVSRQMPTHECPSCHHRWQEDERPAFPAE